MSGAVRLLIFVLLVATCAAAEAVERLPTRGPAGRILTTSDVLQISVVNQAELNTTARVEPDGSIVFPYIGRIAAAGLTEDQLKNKIAWGLKRADVVRNPQVMVELTTFGSQVSISGAVGLPGAFVFDRPTTLSQALAKAGGMKEEASAGRVVLRRRGKDGLVDVQHFDVAEILSGASPAREVVLLNNDEIYVEQGMVFYLYGYVAKPGQYPINRPAMSVQQAVALAGGLSPLGSDWRIEIRRRASGGAVMDIPASLDDVIEPNDTIVVNERLF